MMQPAALAPQTIRPLKRAEYDQLVAAGAFENDPVELIHGYLVTMAANDPAHASPIEILTTLLVRAIGDRGRVRVQLPIAADNESEPEPDLAIVPNGNYSAQHPDRAQLVIEVAVSSLQKDRQVKGPLYAACGFPEYWIVNVPDRCVEVFRDPEGGTYRDVSVRSGDAVLRPAAFPDIEIPVAALFDG